MLVFVNRQFFFYVICSYFGVLTSLDRTLALSSFRSTASAGSLYFLIQCWLTNNVIADLATKYSKQRNLVQNIYRILLEGTGCGLSRGQLKAPAMSLVLH